MSLLTPPREFLWSPHLSPQGSNNRPLCLTKPGFSKGHLRLWMSFTRNGVKKEVVCFLFSSLVLHGIHPHRIYENVNRSNKSVPDVHSNNLLAGRAHLFTSSIRIPWDRLNPGFRYLIESSSWGICQDVCSPYTVSCGILCQRCFKVK